MRLLATLLIALALFPVVVAAQDLDSAPITVDPVAAALSADAIEGCDDIGRAILFSDLDDPDFPMEKGMACHRGVGATVMAVCTLPLTNTAIIKGQLLLKKDEAIVVCNVAVIAVGESQVYLLPEQFRLLTSDDDEYPSVSGFQGTEFVHDPLCPKPHTGAVTGGRCANYPSLNGQLDIRILQSDTITPKGSGEGLELASGSLIFRVKTPMPVPFLLIWEPSPASDPPWITVVSDRFLDPNEIP